MTITSSSYTLLIIYPKEMKTNYKFIMSLFLIFQNWNQPSKWADLLQQVNGLTGVHTNYRILLINKKEQTVIHTETWMNLQRIMLCDKSESPKITYDFIYITFLIQHSFRIERLINARAYRVAEPGEGWVGGNYNRTTWVIHVV